MTVLNIFKHKKKHGFRKGIYLEAAERYLNIDIWEALVIYSDELFEIEDPGDLQKRKICSNPMYAVAARKNYLFIFKMEEKFQKSLQLLKRDVSRETSEKKDVD